LLANSGNLGLHQFRARNNLIGAQQKRSKANKKSAKLLDFIPLITAWLQVRVLPDTPRKSMD
jgi:hypothetical protein